MLINYVIWGLKIIIWLRFFEASEVLDAFHSIFSSKFMDGMKVLECTIPLRALRVFIFSSNVWMSQNVWISELCPHKAKYEWKMGHKDDVSWASSCVHSIFGLSLRIWCFSYACLTIKEFKVLRDFVSSILYSVFKTWTTELCPHKSIEKGKWVRKMEQKHSHTLLWSICLGLIECTKN